MNEAIIELAIVWYKAVKKNPHVSLSKVEWRLYDMVEAHLNLQKIIKQNNKGETKWKQ